MYLLVVGVMVGLAVALICVGLLGQYFNRRKKAVEEAAVGTDDELTVTVSSADEAAKQEVRHLLFWDPFTHEPVDEGAAEIVHMTVLMPDGSEPQISVTVNPTTASRYLSKDGGPRAFRDSIIEMEGGPGWCLAAISEESVIQPTSLHALYDVIVGRMVENGDVDGWLQTLQAYWEFETGYFYGVGETTGEIDMSMTQPLD